MHWINVICLVALLSSGLQIFNAHPRSTGAATRATHARAADHAKEVDGNRRRRHARRFRRVRHGRRAGHLARSRGSGVAARAFPSWATIPGPQWLADGPPLAFLLCLDLRHQRCCLSALDDLQRPPAARPGAHPRGSARHRPLRSATTCCCAIRMARRRGATTCCRTLPTSRSCSACCR